MKSWASKILAISQMLKFFSQYGVRALLVLFMVQSLQLGDFKAFGINALFCALVEFSGVLGGIIADRWIGLKRASQIGSIFLVLGFIGLVSSDLFFESLGLLVLGSSLFSSNIIALFGKSLQGDETEKKKSFTYFYMLQNFGGLVSVLLCSFVQQQYGFQYAFIIPAAGMILSCLLICLGNKNPLPKETPKTKVKIGVGILCLLVAGGAFAALQHANLFLPLIPFILVGLMGFFIVKLVLSPDFTRIQIRQFVGYLGAVVLFYAIEDQMFSSLMVFTEQNIQRDILGYTIPSAFVMAINPIIILGLGGIMARRKVPLLAPFFLLSLSFAGLALLCLLGISIPIFVVMLVVITISIGEVMVGPLIYSFTSNLGEKKRGGELMGILSIAFSLAYTTGGALSQGVSLFHHHYGVVGYGMGFGCIALLVIFGGIALQLLVKKRKNEVRQVVD